MERKSVKKRKIQVKGDYKDGLYILRFSLDDFVIVMGASNYKIFDYEENLTNKINAIFHNKTTDYVYCSDEELYNEIEKLKGL